MNYVVRYDVYELFCTVKMNARFCMGNISFVHTMYLLYFKIHVRLLDIITKWYVLLTKTCIFTLIKKYMKTSSIALFVQL